MKLEDNLSLYVSYSLCTMHTSVKSLSYTSYWTVQVTVKMGNWLEKDVRNPGHIKLLHDQQSKWLEIEDSRKTNECQRLRNQLI